ncbi:MAG: amidohydrolase family protein [Synergistaceae bacterium]|nr:amidohydrolase family protein [Synergistaceae bacterium]
MAVIDSHVHIYPDFLRKERDRIAAREPWFELLTSSKVQKWGTAEELVAAMDEAGIERSVATSFAFLDQGLCREMNDYVLEAARRFPGRIVPLAVVSPARAGAAAEACRAFELGAAGIGELFPDGQRFALSSAAQLRELCALCGERDKFILFHCAEQAGHSYPGKGSCGAREAAAFCRNFPLVKVIFAHFGGGLWAFEAMPEMRLLTANARYDSAAWPWLYEPRIAEAIFAIGAGEKILFGSDWPILDFARYEKLLARTRLTPEQKQALLSDNARRLLSC